MILSFLVSSRIIYKERYYRTRTIHKIEITQNEYSRYENFNSKGINHALFIEKEYDDGRYYFYQFRASTNWIQSYQEKII